MEQVLVVPREKLLGGKPLPHGFSKDNLDELLTNINKFSYFVNRPDTENNPALKQIIPYLLVRHQDKIFLVQRLAAQTEKRLHNKHSIGIGGHINPEAETKDIIKSGLERELHEELTVTTPYKYKLIGCINDDTNSVGQVHFGLVFEVLVDDAKGVEVNEKDLMVGNFVTASQVQEQFELLETWSQLVYKGCFNIN